MIKLEQDQTGFPKYPAESLWRRTCNMIIENPTRMFCVKKAFGTWCILDPAGHILAMKDLWGDALAIADNVYIAWAERYCKFINTSLGDFFDKYHRHPSFTTQIERAIARNGQETVHISPDEVSQFNGEPEFEPQYPEGEYEE